MCIYYLYIKQHKITKLKYLGQTKRNPNIYKGSGVDWINHLKEHGNLVETTILITTTDKNERNYWGRYYSELYNVVESDQWANRIPETGGGVGNNLSTDERKRIGKICVAKQIQENKHNWSKTGAENANYDDTLYKFEHVITGEIIESTQYNFRVKFGFLQGNVSSLINGFKKTCGKWKMHGTSTPSHYLEHTFINNKTHEIVTMTQDAFVKSYNLNRGHVCQMIKRNKKYQSVKSWKLHSF